MPASSMLRVQATRVVLLLLVAGAVTWAARTALQRPAAPVHAPQVPADAVARVGNGFIRESDLREAVRRARGTGVSNALETLIRRELFFQEAQRTGFADRPEIAEAWRSFLAQRFEESQLAGGSAATQVTESELAEYHRSQSGRYVSAERRRLAVLRLPLGLTASLTSAMEAKVREIHAQAVSTADRQPGFGALAAEYSAHLPSKRLGGEVGWLTRDQASRAWPSAVVDAAFALTTPAQVSQPIAAEEGWYLVKLIEHQPARALALEQVRERVHYDLLRAREQKAAEEVRARMLALHPVEVFSQRLAEVGASGPDPANRSQWASRPPSLPAP